MRYAICDMFIYDTIPIIYELPFILRVKGVGEIDVYNPCCDFQRRYPLLFTKVNDVPKCDLAIQYALYSISDKDLRYISTSCSCEYDWAEVDVFIYICKFGYCICILFVSLYSIFWGCCVSEDGSEWWVRNSEFEWFRNNKIEIILIEPRQKHRLDKHNNHTQTC